MRAGITPGVTPHGPVIEAFTCNGLENSVILTGDKTLTLAWFVNDADHVKIEVSTTNSGSAASAVPGIPANLVADPREGSLILPPSSLTSLLIWNARYTLTASSKHGVTQRHIDVSAARANIALVCVGGGNRSSFDLGAVTYLRQFLPQAPTIYAGSGFGALTAVGAAANWVGPSAFELFWNNFVTPLDSFYSFGPPVTELFGSHADPILFNSFYDSARNFADSVASGDDSRFVVPVTQPTVNPGAILLSTVQSEFVSEVQSDVKDGASQLLDGASWFGPLATFLEMAVTWAVQFGIQKSHADLIHDILSTFSMVTAAPLSNLIMQFFHDALTKVRNNDAKLRIPLANLELGVTHYADEFGNLFPRGGLLGPAVLDHLVPIETILAAAVAFPGWMTPIKIGDSNYVDGSLRDSAPIGAALDAGADSIIVIQPNQRVLLPATSFDGASIMAVSLRADMMREVGNLDARIDPFEGWGSRVDKFAAPIIHIEATASLSYLTAVDGDVGLKTIWADYGYLRAFDVLAPQILFPKEEDQQLAADARQFLMMNSDLILALRYDSWLSECNLQGEAPLSYLPHVGPKSEIITIADGTAATQIRSNKVQLRQALVDRLQFIQQSAVGRTFPQPPAVPSDATMWFQNFEHHPWTFDAFIAVPLSPWSALGGFATGNIPAALMPPALPNSLFLPLP